MTAASRAGKNTTTRDRPGQRSGWRSFRVPGRRVRRRRPAPGPHPDRARDRRAQPRRRATSCSSASTPAAWRSPAGSPTAIEEFEHVDVPVGALDVAFYRDDIGLRPVQPLGPTEVPVDIAGQGRRARRRRALHRPHGARRARRAHRARPPAGGAARGARRPRPPRAADPRRLRRQEPADPRRRGRAGAPGGDRRRDPTRRRALGPASGGRASGAGGGA